MLSTLNFLSSSLSANAKESEGHILTFHNIAMHFGTVARKVPGNIWGRFLEIVKSQVTPKYVASAH